MRIPALTLALALFAGATTAYAQSAPSGTPPTDLSGSLPTDAGSGTMPGGTTTAATLDGSTVTISLVYPTLDNVLASGTVTVGSAVEVACSASASTNLCASTNETGNGLLDGEYIDLSGTTISAQLLAPFTSASGDSYNGIVFSDLNFGSGYAITGFTLTTNISGLDASDISFTATSLSINLLGLDPSNTTDGSGVGTFSITLQVTAVPEPATASLALLGVAALGLAVRRQRAARGTLARG